MEKNPERVPLNSWLHRAYSALDTLRGEATQGEIIEAIKVAWLPDEPIEMRTLVGLFYKTNTTDVPDEVWILVGDDGRRNTKKSPNPKPDRWKQIGTCRYIEWKDLAVRGTLRSLTMLPTSI